MDRARESLRLYRRVLRLARQQPDPCCRHYAWSRACALWRREAAELSPPRVASLLHDGRAAARQLGRAAADGGGPDAVRLAALAYGLTGRVAHTAFRAKHLARALRRFACDSSPV